MITLRNAAALIMGLCLLTACPDKSGGSSTTESQASTPASAPSATASAKKSAAPAARKLDPLPLTLELPATAKIAESPTGGVLITDGKARFAVGVLKKDLAERKKFFESFALEQFKKWVKEEKDLAIAEFSATSYRAVLIVEVGGKKYRCSNVGMTGAPSADEAEKIVKRCQDLKPAK